MVIQVECESCGHVINAKDEFAGKRAKCPECGESLIVPMAGEASASPVRHAPPARHVEDLSQDAFSPVALGAGVGTALVAAAIWAFVSYTFSYEIGWLAWGAGGAVGLAMAAAGGRGLPMAVTAAVLSLASIFGGKLAAMHFGVQNELEIFVDENFTQAAYDERVVDARDYAALGEGASDEELAAYLEEHRYEAELLPDFRVEFGRDLLAFDAASPEFESWREDSSAMMLEGFSPVDAVIEDLAAVDFLFAFLGLATAFKLLMRATAVSG